MIDLKIMLKKIGVWSGVIFLLLLGVFYLHSIGIDLADHLETDAHNIIEKVLNSIISLFTKASN